MEPCNLVGGTKGVKKACSLVGGTKELWKRVVWKVEPRGYGTV